jgi:hypothetical protein
MVHGDFRSEFSAGGLVSVVAENEVQFQTAIRMDL